MDPASDDSPTCDDASGLSDRAQALYLRLKLVAGLIAEAPPGTGARLLWRDGGGATQCHTLTGEVVIGRDRSCGLVLTHPQISRRHCRVWLDESGGAWLEDLGSTHSTLLNGSPVLHRALLDGDVIDLGGAALGYYSAGSGALPAAADQTPQP